MPFVDLGTTKRRKMTPSRALKIWEDHHGICVLCDELIDGARERWFIEHPRALELAGEDTNENCGPAHYRCKSEKDADDHHRAAKAKAAKRAHIGIRSTKSKPLPGGRNSPWKQKLNGDWVRREP
jgi:5-methylcytosine-specific restriction protein A